MGNRKKERQREREREREKKKSEALAHRPTGRKLRRISSRSLFNPRIDEVLNVAKSSGWSLEILRDFFTRRDGNTSLNTERDGGKRLLRSARGSITICMARFRFVCR